MAVIISKTMVTILREMDIIITMREDHGTTTTDRIINRDNMATTNIVRGTMIIGINR